MEKINSQNNGNIPFLKEWENPLLEQKMEKFHFWKDGNIPFLNEWKKNLFSKELIYSIFERIEKFYTLVNWNSWKNGKFYSWKNGNIPLLTEWKNCILKRMENCILKRIEISHSSKNGKKSILIRMLISHS